MNRQARAVRVSGTWGGLTLPTLWRHRIEDSECKGFDVVEHFHATRILHTVSHMLRMSPDKSVELMCF